MDGSIRLRLLFPVLNNTELIKKKSSLLRKIWLCLDTTSFTANYWYHRSLMSGNIQGIGFSQDFSVERLFLTTRALQGGCDAAVTANLDRWRRTG